MTDPRFAGRATTIDDAVEQWHNGFEPSHNMELHEWLGIEPDAYAHWAENGTLAPDSPWRGPSYVMRAEQVDIIPATWYACQWTGANRRALQAFFHEHFGSEVVLRFSKDEDEHPSAYNDAYIESLDGTLDLALEEGDWALSSVGPTGAAPFEQCVAMSNEAFVDSFRRRVS